MRWYPTARLRPLRPRETKTYGPQADVATPLLQYLVAVLVLALDVILCLSWVMLVPPVLVWLAGMVLFALAPPAIWFVVTGWILVNLCGVRSHHTKTILGHFLTALFILAVTATLVYHVVWDWWEGICYGGFFGIPTPHLTVSPPIVAGVVLIFLGAVFTLWKPSRYTFALQVLGALTGIVAWWYRPPSLYWTRGATTSLSKGDLIFYGVWAAVCVGVIVPSRFLLDRMFTEMEDDFPYEFADPPPPKVVTQREVSMVPVQRYPSPPAQLPTVVRTWDGSKEATVRMDELVEFLYLAERKGTFARTQLFPHKFDCSGRKVTQHYHWRELIEPLAKVGIYDVKAREVALEYQKADGTLDVPQVLARTGWDGH